MAWLSLVVVLSLAVSSSGSFIAKGKWIPSERCTATYTESDLDWSALSGKIPRCEPNGTVKVGPNHERLCERIIHSCSREEMATYHMQPPLALEWSEANPVYTKYLWTQIYHKLANQTIYMTGDSMTVQLKTSLILYLRSIGFECTNDVCPNGLQIIKPGFNHLTKEAVNDYVIPKMLLPETRLFLFNTGLHYGGGDCPGNTICADLLNLFRTVNETLTAHPDSLVRYAWISCFRSHFGTPTGSYEEFKKLNHHLKNGTVCLPVPAKEVFVGGYHEPTKFVQKHFPYIRVVEVEDLMYTRSDLNQGPLTYHNFEQLDCLHLCMQPCFWEAYMWRLGQEIAEMLEIF
jgi:hypothetical protein